MSGIVLNGRFLTQRTTGVQRYAQEMTRALDALAGEGAAPPLRLLVPPGAAAPPLAHVAVEAVGSRGGQAWEQLALPRAARGALLLSLGNTGPLLAGARQAVVIHDAGAFDTPESYSPAFRTWYRLLQRGLARRGARIVTVSHFSRGRIAAHLKVPAEAIGVTGEGGEHVLRTPADPGVLARHGLSPGRFALAVGTGAAHKNLAALSAASSLLAGRGLRLVLAGAADPAVFQGAGGAPGAVPLGRVTDAELRALYEAAFCLVFPSRYEGFGLPPLEAMLCGCPVLAARAGAVPEVVGEAGLWFDPATPATLADALGRLLDEPGLRDALREAGRARAAGFTWRAAAAALLRLLDGDAR